MYRLRLLNQHGEFLETRTFEKLEEVYAWVAGWHPETKLKDPILDGVPLSPQFCRAMSKPQM